MADQRPDAADDLPDDDRRRPVDQVVDYCVLAPIGFALEARSLLPTFIERGRAQVGVAKMVGEFAVKWGSTRVESAVVDAQEQAMGLLRLTGLAPLDDRDRGPEGPGTTADEPTDELEARREAPASAGSGTGAGDPATGETFATTVPEAEADDVDVDVDTLAIPDYDNLSASQVLPRLDGLEPDELEAVGRYERSGRGRKTILNRVAQLQHPDD